MFGSTAIAAMIIAMLALRGMTQQTREQKDSPTDLQLRHKQIFPIDNPWNQDISGKPVDAMSAAILRRIGMTTGLHPDFGTTYRGVPNGIPFVVVPAAQPKVAVSFQYADESDPGPYPIPPDAPIEGGAASDGDRHVIVIDADHDKLYELFSAHHDARGNGWSAGSGAIFDLSANSLRPAGWTSADAAGLPIFPGLVRYDEVINQKAVRHAFRFTVVKSRHAYVAPARHFASPRNDPDLPPMGMRVRLKSGYDISKFPPQSKVILQAIKTYGMLLADNGGDWYLSGAPDPRWDDEDLSTLKRVKVSDFEVVEMGPATTR
jgi:hypothetical protein